MEIVITGSVAYDYLMRFPGRFAEHFIAEELHQISLSFLVDDMTRHWGGVAANIAFTLAKFGVKPKLMGTVGRDFSEYRKWLENAGVDTSTVKQIDEVFTASFFANTDMDNNQIASFYAGAMGLAGDYKLSDALANNPELVVISPNAPAAMTNLAAECRQRNIPFLYDPSQQIPRLTGDELRRDMQGAHGLVVNGYEASIICEKTGLTIDELREMLELLIITYGKDGSKIYSNGEVIEVEAFPTNTIKDPTGAGDAYRAGLLAGMSLDMPIKLAGQMGSLCSTYVLEQVGTQNHSFTRPEFVERFRTHWDDEGRLDTLLT